MMTVAFLLALAPAWSISAYSADCRGCSGIGANGRSPVVGVSVACPRSLAMDARVWIEGVGRRVCHDRGAGIYGMRLDVFMPSASDARQFGRRSLKVIVR